MYLPIIGYTKKVVVAQDKQFGGNRDDTSGTSFLEQVSGAWPDHIWRRSLPDTWGGGLLSEG